MSENRMCWCVIVLRDQEEGERTVCVPNSWVRLRHKDKAVVMLPPPQEKWTRTRKRAKAGEKYSEGWDIHLGTEDNSFDDYDTAVAYINMLRKRSQSFTEHSKGDADLSTQSEATYKSSLILHSPLTLIISILPHLRVHGTNQCNKPITHPSHNINTFQCHKHESVAAVPADTLRTQDKATQCKPQNDRQVLEKAKQSRQKRKSADNIDDRLQAAPERATGDTIEAKKHRVTFETPSAKQQEITNNNYDSSTNRTQDGVNTILCPDDLMIKRSQSIVPPEYDVNDTKWTYKHRKKAPGLVELTIGSGVYIDERRLQSCVQNPEDCRTLVRNLSEVFTTNALNVCAIQSKKETIHESQPGLDEGGRNALLDYVLRTPLENGADNCTYADIHTPHTLEKTTKTAQFTPQDERQGSDKANLFADKRTVADNISDQPQTAPKTTTGNPIEAKNRCATIDSPSAMQQEITKNNYDSSTNRTQDGEKIRRRQPTSLILPPEYDANDTKWTLNHRKKAPGLVELTNGSGVYVDERRLQTCTLTSYDYRTLAGKLLPEVFTTNALNVCSLKGRKFHSSDPRLSLDRGGRNAILDYVLWMSLENGWDNCTEADINIVMDKILTTMRPVN